MKRTLAAYIQLTKPRILGMVLVTFILGFFLGGQGLHSLRLLVLPLIGTAMVTGGASALNHYLERDADAKMDRTQNRPIPSGAVSPNAVMLFGVYLVLGGTLLLLWTANMLTAFLAILTAFLYVVVYTPMKRLTWLNTIVGAIPGAIPPMGGWAAATGRLDPGAWVLFAILFVWQHPHFYSIAWMFRDDYRKGGFKMLPVVEPDGHSTFRQVVFFSAILIPVSLLPTLIHITGWVYFWGALAMGITFLATGAAFYRTGGSNLAAQRVLRASVVYLPLLLMLIVLDHGM